MTSIEYVAGWYEAAGAIPSSGHAENHEFLVAGFGWRSECLAGVQEKIGGEIREFETKNGKRMNGLYLSRKEWIKTLDQILPHLISEAKQTKVQRLINSLKG